MVPNWFFKGTNIKFRSALSGLKLVSFSCFKFVRGSQRHDRRENSPSPNGISTIQFTNFYYETRENRRVVRVLDSCLEDEEFKSARDDIFNN